MRPRWSRARWNAEWNIMLYIILINLKVKKNRNRGPRKHALCQKCGAPSEKHLPVCMMPRQRAPLQKAVVRLRWADRHECSPSPDSGTSVTTDLRRAYVAVFCFLVSKTQNPTKPELSCVETSRKSCPWVRAEPKHQAWHPLFFWRASQKLLTKQ